MSHLTNIKSCFQNLFCLETALEKMKLENVEIQKTLSHDNLAYNLIISQSNGHKIKFIRNENQYDLVTDIQFWNQPQSIEKFYEDLSQKYMTEFIVRNGQEITFSPVKLETKEITILELQNFHEQRLIDINNRG